MKRLAILLMLWTSLLGCSTRVPDSTPDLGRADAGVDAGFNLDFSYDAQYIDGEFPDGTCAAVHVETTRTTPSVILVIDQSGSMIMDFDGDASRWSVLRDALISSPNGLVTTLQSSVRFGAVMYTDDPEVGSCPDLATAAAQLNALSTVGGLYGVNFPAGNTPTGDAIQSVISNIDTLAPTHSTDRTVLILATDGEPGTCADGTDVDGGRTLVVNQVTAAHALGIDTFVISVGVGIAVDHLQDVANAGIGRSASDADAPFWVATNTEGLTGALSTIVGGVVSCDILLAGRIEPALACDGTVTLGSDELECGSEWRPVDTNHIELLGDACDRLLRMSEDLDASFPCNVLL